MVMPLAFIGEGVFYAIFTGCIFVLIVWGVEAYAIKTKLKDNTKKPLKVSFIANAITSLMGVVYFFLLLHYFSFIILLLEKYLGEFISVLFFVLLAPFYITFYTEAHILKKYYKIYPYKQLKNVSLQMNITTYFLFFFLILATIDKIGMLILSTPILAYYLVRLFQMYTFEMNIKKHKQYIYSTLIVIITFAVMATVTIGPLAPPQKYSGRERAHDASIKATLAGARANAELYYDNNSNSYKGLCSDSKTVGSIKQTISQYDEIPYLCQDSEQKYCISAQLPSSIRDAAKYFCIDSTGYADTTLHNYCTDGNYNCSSD